MTATARNATGTTVEFGATEFKATAALYALHGPIINAASRYDNLDDAMAGLKAAWEALEVQADKGATFTPSAELGFGSDNATTIAETLLGRRPGVGATRKSFKSLGK